MGIRDKYDSFMMSAAPYMGAVAGVAGSVMGGPIGSAIAGQLGVMAGERWTPELAAQYQEVRNYGSKSWLTDFTGELEKGASENKISDLMATNTVDLEKMVSHYQGKEIKAAGFTDAKDYLDTLKERSQTKKKTRDMTLLQPGTKQTILTTGIRE